LALPTTVKILALPTACNFQPRLFAAVDNFALYFLFAFVANMAQVAMITAPDIMKSFDFFIKVYWFSYYLAFEALL